MLFGAFKTYITNPLLRFAAGYNYPRVVSVLLNHGLADAYSPDRFGWTALHYTAMNAASDAMQVLIENFHVNANVRDAEGRTPLFLAVHRMEQTHDRESEKRYMDFIKKLVNEFNANVIAKDNDGYTIVHLAARDGNTRTLRTFIEDFGVDPNIVSNTQSTPLHLAAMNGRTEVARALVNDFNADLTKVDDMGDLPLHSALRFASHTNLHGMFNLKLGNGQEEIARLLITKESANASPYVSANLLKANKGGETPIKMAINREVPGVVMLLLQNGAVLPKEKEHFLVNHVNKEILQQFMSQQAGHESGLRNRAGHQQGASTAPNAEVRRKVASTS